MKRMKRTISILLMAVLVLALSGCGKDTSMDVGEILTKSQEQSEQAKSMDAKANMKLSMASGEESMDMNIDMNMTIFTDPYKIKVNMIMDMGALGKQDSEMYMMEEDGKFYMYTGTSGTWYKQEMDQALFEQTLQGYDNSAYTDALMECSKDFTVEQVEENGKKLYKLDGIITGESMKKMMESMQIMEQLGELAEANALLEDMGDISMTVWVDKESYEIQKLSMDMTGMMKKIMESAASEASSEEQVTINTCIMDTEYTGYNSSADFELPEGAKNAELLDMSLYQ